MHEILEYILPIVFASGEAMLGVLMFVILIVVGRGKILPSEKVLVIERPGQYRMVLAPGLNLAQAFIEQLARQLAQHAKDYPEGLSCGFEIRDKHVATAKQPFYLLTLSARAGALYVEAKYPALASAQDDAVKPDQATRAAIENVMRALEKTWGIDWRAI